MIKKYNSKGEVIIEKPVVIRPSLFFVVEVFEDEFVFSFPCKYHRLAVERVQRLMHLDEMQKFEGTEYYINEVYGDENTN